MTRAAWLKVARGIYFKQGFPREEMVRYYRQGMTPLAAVEAATARRRKA